VLTRLELCDVNDSVLADGLRGNSRLKSLRPRSCFFGNRQALAIAGALRENKGLVDLNLRYGISDETWGAICDSLKTHPTLQVLDLVVFGQATTAPVVTQTRIQALLDMMKMNMSINTIRLDYHYSKHEIYRESVIPYLETNWFRSRLLAIQKIRPITYRTKVLGRALLSARSNANSFWILLSGNAEVAFLSTTAKTTLATDLPSYAYSFCYRYFKCCCYYRRYWLIPLRRRTRRANRHSGCGNK
jgi:hypothetical protein